MTTEKLIVTLVEAKGLAPKDEDGFSDPYAFLFGGRSKFRTKTISHTLDPVWKESFTIQLHRHEPFYIEIWDRDQMTKDDFEGCVSVDWFDIPELNKTGQFKGWFKVQQQVKQNVEKKGALITGEILLELTLPEFAERLQQQGQLRAIFGELPSTERVVFSTKCSFGIISSSEPPQQRQQQQQQQTKTNPGYCFLLNHYLFAYAVTPGKPIQVQFSYEEVRTADKNSSNSIVISLSSGQKYIFSALADPNIFHARLVDSMRRCYASEEPTDLALIPNTSISTLSPNGTPDSTTPSPSIPQQQQGGEMIARSIVFKVSLAFKNVVERVLRAANLTNLSAEKYRLFPALPAIGRTFDASTQKITSKLNVHSLLKSHVISHGCALILKEYIHIERGIEDRVGKFTSKKVENPIQITVNVLKDRTGNPNSIAQLDLNILPHKPLSCVIDAVVLTQGLKAERLKLCLVSLNAEATDANAEIPLDISRSPSEYHLVDGDLLEVVQMPHFHNLEEKFGKLEENIATFNLISHCETEPITEKPSSQNKDEKISLQLKEALKITQEQCISIENAVKENSKFGQESILLELLYRLKASLFNPHYSKESFSDEHWYQLWLDETKSEVLKLMRNIVFEKFPFCGELHVTLIKATDLIGADMSGLSDPFCTVNFRGQRKTTKTLKKTLNPEWQETLTFSMTSIDSKVYFSVWDWDRFSKAELLGKASINLRENISLLDGQRHELAIPLIKKGTLVIGIQLYSEFSHLLFQAQTFEMNPSKSTPQPTLDFASLYNTLFTAIGNQAFSNPLKSWILEEFSVRFGVSQTYCSILSLQSLLMQEHTVNAEYTRNVETNLLSLLRPTALRNFAEFTQSNKLQKLFFDSCSTELLPMCFALPEGAISVTEPIIKALLEMKELQKDNIGDTTTVIIEGLKIGTQTILSRLTRDIPWNKDDSEAPATSVSKILQETLPEQLEKLSVLIRAVIPTTDIPKAKEVITNQISYILEGITSSLCSVVSKSTARHQGIVFDCLLGLNHIEDLTKQKTEKELVIPTYTGLLLCWVKKSQEVLSSWVDRAIQIDKRKPLKENVLHSSAIIDVSDACSQILSQLKQLRMKDVFVFAQLGEIVVSALSRYFQEESKAAMDIIFTSGEQITKNIESLTKCCVAMSNIEKGQEVLDTIITDIENGIEGFKKQFGNSDRVLVSSQSLNAGVSAALKNSKEGLSRPIQALASIIQKSLTPIVEEATKSGKDLSSPLSSALDESLSPIHEHVTRNCFKNVLQNTWIGLVEILYSNIKPENHINSSGKGLHSHAICASFTSAIDILIQYFNASGEGLSVTNLQTIPPLFVVIRRLLKLYLLPTEMLIEIVSGLRSNPQKIPDDPFLKETNPDEIDHILEARKLNGDVWAKSYSKQSAGSAESQQIRKKFALPPSELLIDKWKCTEGKKIGTLYLTSRHICFDVLLTAQEEDDGSQRIVIMLKDLTVLEQTSVSLFFKGIAIKGVGNDPPIVFSSFVPKVTDVIAIIASQANLIGNSEINTQHP